MNHANIAISNSKKLIVVLGMHCSDTSAITKGLQVMGVQLGNRLIPAIVGNNDKGFWEDIDLNNLNNEILETICKEWHYFISLQKEEVEILRQKGYFERAVAMLRQKVADSSIYGIKDPRISILLPFWKEVFSFLNYEVHYIVAVRHPMSVAKSLFKRDSFDIDKSYLLWQIHVINSLSGTINCSRIIIDYDKLLLYPEKEMKRIANTFNLEIDNNELEIFNKEFLDNNLRHSIFTADDLLLDIKASALVREVYEIIMELSAGIQIDESSLTKQIEKWEKELLYLTPVLSIADKLSLQISTINAVLEQKGNPLNELTEKLYQKNEELKLKNEELGRKNEELNQRNQVISQILVSKSWRITKPFRAVFEFLKNFSMNLVLKKSFWYMSKVIFYLLPFSGRARERLKKVFFSNFPGLYYTIKSNEIGCLVEYSSTNIELSIQGNRNKIIQKVTFKENKPIIELPVKVLSFYLPQFHAIPENDAWWGDGFTEWNNVKQAQPLFEGHYQPHVPGELGYYNLVDIKIQERQIELAKNYGIGGFCFHFYWFNGKRLLEKPIENYLLNPQLDFPFCISWANENWTRSWDGLDNEILIKQNHSIEDDLAFIQHVSKYLLDKRYIRINNKPLLIVYRPNLFPSAIETAGRWRNWCKENGLGEIYLAYVQSFEKTNPYEIGFDAAIEFAPNSINTLLVTHLIKPINKDLEINVRDWNTMVVRSKRFSVPDYKLFRCVCPSWDNSPRRKNGSTIYINNHPDGFQEWVYNSAKDAISRFENPDERLVFVNAWNEWAEGAHLEPDEKYGYAYLQCIYNSLSYLSLQNR